MGAIIRHAVTWRALQNALADRGIRDGTEVVFGYLFFDVEGVEYRVEVVMRTIEWTRSGSTETETL